MTAFGEPLDEALVDLFDTQVAPRFLSAFGDRLLEAMLPGDQARVAHLGCRTGLLDVELARRAGASELVGIDASPLALERARRRAPEHFFYVEAAQPSPLPSDCFSHAVSLFSIGLSAGEAAMLVEESRRLLRRDGQLLLLMPLRGSFAELLDLLREQAQALGSAELWAAVEALAAERPGVEQATEALESAGFADVDVGLHRLSLDYETGAQFFDDPTVLLLLEPPLRRALPPAQAEAVSAGLRRSIDLYWSDMPFELTLNLGCISARR